MTKQIIKRVIVCVAVGFILSLISSCEVKAVTNTITLPGGSFRMYSDWGSGETSVSPSATVNGVTYFNGGGTGAIEYAKFKYQYNLTYDNIDLITFNIRLWTGQQTMATSVKSFGRSCYFTQNFRATNEYFTEIAAICPFSKDTISTNDNLGVINVNFLGSSVNNVGITDISIFPTDSDLSGVLSALSSINGNLTTINGNLTTNNNKLDTLYTAISNFTTIYQLQDNANTQLILNALSGNQNAINNVNNSVQQNVNATQEVNQSIKDMENTIKDDNVDNPTDYSGNVASNGVITQLITLPITLYTKILNSTSSNCSPFNLGTLYGEELIMPCINLQNYLGSTLFNVIDILISGLFIYAVSRKMIKVFNSLSSLKDGDVIDG